jgi:hypothetical protein
VHGLDRRGGSRSRDYYGGKRDDAEPGCEGDELRERRRPSCFRNRRGDERLSAPQTFHAVAANLRAACAADDGFDR